MSMRVVLGRWARPLRSPARRWDKGIDDELSFWRNWFATQGSEWPEDYRRRLDPNQPLLDYVAPWVTGATVRVLDAGAGPITRLGYALPGTEVHVDAVDALADLYDELLVEAGIVPPVRTQKCDSERLTDLFPPATFDLAHASNTLDHSYDPLRAIKEMAMVTKPDGSVILSHYRNEAEAENYQGFHQWNFEAEPTSLRIWRPGRSAHVERKLSHLIACQEVHQEPGGQEVVVFRRL